MTGALIQLGASDLRALAVAIRGGRLVPPFDTFAVQRILGACVASDVALDLATLANGASAHAVARFVELLSDAEAQRPRLEDRVGLVTTGVDLAANSRDTMVVVQDLFRRAETDVLVSGYTIHDGRSIFQPLGECLEKHPQIRVRLFLNIGRKRPGVNPVQQFLADFAEWHWPAGRTLPEIWYDPRSLDTDPSTSAVLHAKCVVIDAAELLVSSANLTEAAHLRNIEVGVLIRSSHLAVQLIRFFDGLIAGGHLRRAEARSANV